jgi:hypothetical protein
MVGDIDGWLMLLSGSRALAEAMSVLIAQKNSIRDIGKRPPIAIIDRDG